MNNPGALRRIWLLTAQVIAIAAGVLIAWQAFGPVRLQPIVLPALVWLAGLAFRVAKR